MAALLLSDAIDLPTLPKAPEPRAAEREDVAPVAAGSRFWFSFEGWEISSREDDFVLA